MGAYGPLFSAVKFGDAMNKGLTIHTNQCPVKRQWPRLFEHVRNGYLKPSELVTHRVPLERHRRGLPHVLGQARRLHQAARRPDRRVSQETQDDLHTAEAADRRVAPRSCGSASRAGASTSTPRTARRCRS